MYRKIISILLAVVLLAGCADKGYKSTYDEYKNFTAKELYFKAKQSASKKNYLDAIKYYEALDVLYPFGQYAQKGQLEVIDAYYKSGDLESTIATASRYTHLYPQDVKADYVYYMRGLANFKRKRSWERKIYDVGPADRDLSTLKEAFKDFSTLVRYYPNSKYAADAKKRLIYIRNAIAKHEVDVAGYYLKKHAYVAAANRAAFVVQHLQTTPYVIEALKIMVKSYTALGATDQADTARKILLKNYPATR